MDPLTQGLLGATIGQAGYGRRLGRDAVVWGALGGMLPDIDVAASLTGPMGEWLWHRGPTHSLWFGPVVGTALGAWLSRRAARRGQPGQRRDWIGLMILAILTHPLLDLFTTYGTQLLSPFSNQRFALDAVAIIDPGYSLLLAAALFLGWRGGWGASISRGAAWLALLLSTAFLFYGLTLNGQAASRARADLEAQGARPVAVSSYPTLLQPWLRRVVARTDADVYVGWLSLWNSDRAVTWRRFVSANDAWVDAVRGTREGRVFEWFAMGQTAASVLETPTGTVVEIDDIRYGVPEPPHHGLWALRAELHSDGSLVRPPYRVRREPSAPPGVLLQQLVLMTFGG